MPFECDNPTGYTAAVCIQCILVTYIFFCTMTVVSIGVASYLYEISFTKDIKSILQSIDENSKTKKRRRRLYAQFVEFVDVHSATKQLSKEHLVKSNHYSMV